MTGRAQGLELRQLGQRRQHRLLCFGTSFSSRSSGYTPSQRGFTTIELMVVLVVMALMSGLVIASMGPAMREAKLRTGCRTIVSVLVYARSYAVSHRTETRVLFNRPASVSLYRRGTNERGEESLQPVLTQPGRPRHLPNGVSISSINKPGAQEQGDRHISFTSLGRSEDGVITLTDINGKRRVIVVDAITGRCSVEKPEIKQ